MFGNSYVKSGRLDLNQRPLRPERSPKSVAQYRKRRSFQHYGWQVVCADRMAHNSANEVSFDELGDETTTLVELRMSIELQHKDGVLRVEQSPETETRYRLQVEARASGESNTQVGGLKGACETSYPLDLIEAILQAKGLAYVCDEIMRDELPSYVEETLRADLFAYVGEEVFEDKKILDFGCGCGASTMVLSRLLPKTRIVGLELVEEYVSIAEMRKQAL